jgi:outer membrane protein W
MLVGHHLTTKKMLHQAVKTTCSILQTYSLGRLAAKLVAGKPYWHSLRRSMEHGPGKFGNIDDWQPALTVKTSAHHAADARHGFIE